MPFPTPDSPAYDAWIEDRAALGEARDDERRMKEQEVADHRAQQADEMDAYASISDAVQADLVTAVRLACQWLDVPTVLRTVATTIEEFDHGSDPDLPF